MTKVKHPILTSILLIALVTKVTAQEAQPPVEEPEAPAALFDEKVGDVGVVLEADGTWTTRLAGGWGSGFSPQGSLPGLGYPGFERTPVFVQEPDFSLTLRLMERYYLEVSYRGSLDDRTFLLGYDGKKGETVQWVKLGNDSFTVPQRAGDTLAAGRRGAPALGAAFSWGNVDAELLTRYEDGTRETRSFRGYQDLNESSVGIDAWIRDRFFRLPGPYPLTGVQILIADPSGSLSSTLGTYRVATSSEVSFDSTTGLVRLPSGATRRYLVRWDQQAGGYTSALLQIVAITEAVTGLGTCFVLAQPGIPSEFELRNRYPTAKGTLGAVILIDQNSSTPVSGYPVLSSPGQEWFEVGGNEEAPFVSLVPGIYPDTHPGTPPPRPAVLPYAFKLPRTTFATSYSLGSDLIASSLVVVRNGIPTNAFRFDAPSGTLTLDTPVYDTDSVEVSYQRLKTAGKATDLVFWQGGKWTISDQQSLDWNVQGRWNMDQSSYTTEDLQSPGRMSTTVAWNGSSGPWTWSLAATGGTLLADSTGHRRLYGQGTAGTQASYDGQSLRPSALPPSLGLSVTNRAPTRFRDLWTVDPLTGKPQVSPFGTPGVGVEPWAADGWMGPYLARGDGLRSERLVVVEADLTGPGSWSGAQVFLDKGKPVDYRGITAVTLNVRLLGGLPGDAVTFQAGALSENFDGTGAVRTLDYRSKPSLAFLDQGTRRYFPIPEDSSWGNDASLDGTAGGDGTLISTDLAAATPGFDPTSTQWQALRLVLSDQDRQRLAGMTGWRIVLVGSGTAATRTLLVGAVVFEGSSWSVAASAGTSGQVNPVETDDPSRSGRKQVNVFWSSRQNWTIESRHATLRPASYRTLSFQVQNALVPVGTTMSFDLLDSSGKGLHASWPAVTGGGWRQGRIDLKSLVLTFDGVPAGTVSTDGGVTSWDRMRISKSSSSADTGSWILSEVEAVDPLWEPVESSVATVGWKQDGQWPSHDLSLLSGLAVSATSRQSGVSAEDWAWSGSSQSSGVLGIVRASGEATFTRTARDSTGHGAYEATLPLVWPGGGPGLEWTDRFSDRGLRSERVLLTLPWVGNLEAQARAEGPPTSLDQEYRLSWTSPSQWPEGWTGQLSAQWDQSRPDAPALEGFSRQWTESWSWLWPGEALAPFHLVQSQAQLNGAWGPAGMVAKTNAQAAQTLGSGIKWSPSGSWEIRNPWHWKETTWTLTPSVSKRVESVLETTTTLNPADSAARGLVQLWSQTGGLSSPPFGELGSNPWTDSAVSSGTVTSTGGIDWDRQSQGDWTDIVLPQSGTTQVAATRGKDGSADYSSMRYSLSVLTQARNLFGTLGSQPLVSWYRTEVLSWAFTGSLGTGSRDLDRTADAGVSTKTDLFLTVQESVGLPINYQGRWGSTVTHTLGLKPTWSLKTPANLPFEFPRWLSAKDYKRLWAQDLGASVSFGWQPTTPSVLQDLSVSWKGRLLLSDKSELSLTTRWGQQWRDTLTVVGLDASLDLILSF